MITVEEIKQKAIRRYEDYLRSIIMEDSLFFPLEIRGNKRNEKDMEVLFEQQLPLFENEKPNKGFGYTLNTKINTRPGSIHSIKKIEFETELDYLRFIDRETEAHNFKVLLVSTLTELPELKPLLIAKPALLSKNILKWTDLLEVCRYFKANPYPNLYIRELPVAVDTKFIENNTGDLTKLLLAIIPDHTNVKGKTFADKFNLKTKHNLIRIRFLDDRFLSLFGFDEIGITEIEINSLSIDCRRVFIIENDVTALIFPRLDDSIIIFGQGFNVASLKGISWLKDADIYYCSDIDVQGFEMLSQVRGYFPHVRSFLMDEITFEKFDIGTIGAKSGRPVPNLTNAEKEFHAFLSVNNKRLEHEKIPQAWVQSQLQILLSDSEKSI